MARKFTTLLAVAALAGFAGCGDDDESSDSGSAATPAATATATAPETETETGAGETAASGVAMKGIRFQPAEITVKVGDTVTWTNEDPVDHNAVATSGADFKSELFGEGGTFVYQTEKAGTIEYECTVHPGMTGKITVE